LNLPINKGRKLIARERHFGCFIKLTPGGPFKPETSQITNPAASIGHSLMENMSYTVIAVDKDGIINA
jgi:hypothetical protein